MLWTYKPRLRVRARTARAGEPLELIVVVDAPVPISASALRVRVVSEIESADARAVLTIFEKTLVPGERRIRAGRSEFVCAVDLPAELPPRIDAFLLRVRHRVEVDIDVPWAKDPHVRFELAVLPAAPGDAPLPAGEFRHGPGTEGLPALSGRWEQHEHELRVAIDSQKPLAVEELAVRLVGRVEVTGRKPIELWSFLSVPGDDREGSARFVSRRHERHVYLHPALPPSFSTPHGGLSWALVIGARWFGGKTRLLEVPIQLRTSRPYTAGLLRPDHIEAELSVQQPLSPADEQAALVRGLAVDDGRIMGHVTGANLVVHRELDGRRPLLVADVTYPSLELAMHLRLASQGEHAQVTSFAQPVHIDSSRDPSQVRALCDALPGAAGFALIHASDTGMRLEARESEGGLAGFLTALVALLRGLASARTDLPPSRVIAPYRADWENLAEWLEGTLHAAPFRLTGMLGTLPAEASIVWNGPLPARTRLVLRPVGLQVEPGMRHRWVADPTGLTPDLANDEPLGRLAEDALAASISKDEVSIELDGPVGEQVIRRHLQRMARVVDELRLKAAYR